MIKMQGAAGDRLPELNHLLQHTLQSLCTDSQWVYAVFWRILPRNYPPPQWKSESEAMDRSQGNKRNWIMVWEDGFCNFSACAGAAAPETTARTSTGGNSRTNFFNVATHDKLLHSAAATGGSDDVAERPEYDQPAMNPDLFFKMSQEVYNYGEGFMGKVAADNGLKWVYREPLEEAESSSSSFLSPWAISSLDPHPRPWEAQFKAGIQTIAVIAVEEGVVQLGSTKKIMKDLNFAAQLQRKFTYLRSIPGVFVPHSFFNTSGPKKRMRVGHEGSSPLSGSQRGQWMIRVAEHHQLPASSHLTPRSIDQFLSSRIGSDGWSPRCSGSSLTGSSRQLSHDQTGSIIGVKRPSDGDAQAERVRSYAFDISPWYFQDIGAEFRSSAADVLHTTRSVGGQLPSLIGQLEPSLSSLQALLSKLPSVTPTEPENGSCSSNHQAVRLSDLCKSSNGTTKLPLIEMIDASSANNTPNASSTAVTPAETDAAATAAASKAPECINLNPLVQNFDSAHPDFSLPDTNSIDNNDSYNSFLNEIY